MMVVIQCRNESDMLRKRGKITAQFSQRRQTYWYIPWSQIDTSLAANERIFWDFVCSYLHDWQSIRVEIKMDQYDNHQILYRHWSKVHLKTTFSEIRMQTYDVSVLRGLYPFPFRGKTQQYKREEVRLRPMAKSHIQTNNSCKLKYATISDWLRTVNWSN